jgi:sugar phosphate isomerase/epimerase
MIKGLTRAGVGEVGGFESFVRLAAAHGFASVDVGGGELVEFVRDRGGEGAKAFLQEQGVTVGSIGLPVEWRKTEEVFREGLETLCVEASVAAALGCKSCCTYVLPSTDENPAHYLAVATRRLRLCAQILAAYGMRLGLEFVGPHHLRKAGKYPFIWDLKSTLDWIEVIHEPNVGLLLDVYHWYTTEATLDDLKSLTASQIVHVHLNDAPDVPMSEVLDNDRLFPGEGVIDIPGFLKALKEIGYQGPVAQEVLTTRPLTDPAEVLLERSAAAFRKVFSAAGLE